MKRSLFFAFLFSICFVSLAVAGPQTISSTSSPASTTTAGISRLATTAEATTGTAEDIAVTPKGLKTVADTKQAITTSLTTLASGVWRTVSLAALKAIAVAGIADGHYAIVSTTDGYLYQYTYEASSASAESSPNILQPDDNAGNGRWILQIATLSGVLSLNPTNLPSSDSDPGTTAGQIKHDTDPNVIKWYDGANVRTVFDSLTPMPIQVASGAITVSTNTSYVICTGACQVTYPAAVAGAQHCVRNAPGSATVITLVNRASQYYELTNHSAWATANQKLVSGGVATDSICIVGYDSTHYATMNYVGTWTDTAP